MRKFLLLVVLSLVATTGTVFSQETKKDYGVKVSGVLFSRWEWNMGGAGATEKDFNQFAIERMYLNARGDISEDVGYRATLDVYSVKNSDVGTAGAISNLNAMMQLKYAYFDWRAFSWLTFRGGMQQTEWIEYAENIWRYRGVDKILYDNAGYTSSSDLGLSAIAKLPSKMGDVTLSVFNGPGFRSAENNRFKDIAARVGLTPLANEDGMIKSLAVGAHVYTGATALGLSRSRFGGLVALPTDDFNIGVSFDSRSDDSKSTTGTVTAIKGSGLSVFGELKFKIFTEDLSKFSLIARFDAYNPNTDLDDSKRTSTATSKYTKLILGLTYKPSSVLTFVLDNQQQKYGTADLLTKYDGKKTDTDSKMFLHCIVSY